MAFSKACQKVFARKGMRVNAVCPSFAPTKLVERHSVNFGVPLKVDISVSDVVSVIETLLGPTSTQNGKSIVVTGEGFEDWDTAVAAPKTPSRL